MFFALFLIFLSLVNITPGRFEPIEQTIDLFYHRVCGLWVQAQFLSFCGVQDALHRMYAMLQFDQLAS